MVVYAVATLNGRFGRAADTACAGIAIGAHMELAILITLAGLDGLNT
jgi:hypothetical protein